VGCSTDQDDTGKKGGGGGKKKSADGLRFKGREGRREEKGKSLDSCCIFNSRRGKEVRGKMRGEKNNESFASRHPSCPIGRGGEEEGEGLNPLVITLLYVSTRAKREGRGEGEGKKKTSRRRTKPSPSSSSPSRRERKKRKRRGRKGISLSISFHPEPN